MCPGADIFTVAWWALTECASVAGFARQASNAYGVVRRENTETNTVGLMCSRMKKQSKVEAFTKEIECVRVEFESKSSDRLPRSRKHMHSRS